MRVYVINLARAAARRCDIERAARAHDVRLDFIEATDGRHLSSPDRALVDHARRRTITRFPLSDGEIGCWLSHRRAMQALIDSREAMAAILEDDVDLLPEFSNTLHAIETLANQPHGAAFDLITLHRNTGRRERFVPYRQLMPGVMLGRIGYCQTGNVGYVISRAGARAFVASNPRIVHAIDKQLHAFWLNGLDIYALSRPAVAHDDDGHSYLEETRLHAQPARRARYPDADWPYWRARRLASRTVESLHKRLAFAALVWTERHTEAAREARLDEPACVASVS